MDKRKVIYFEDELNDEFSLAKITPKKIDGSYVYCHSSLFKRFTHFFWYRIVATPIAFFYMKFTFHHKVEGRGKLKAFKNTGYFMYGNHTQDIGDACVPSLLNFPKDDYLIVHPNNVSIPYVGRVTPSLGALPLPDDMKAYRNFISAIERRIKEGNAVVIYPEAHIWPFYTGIRPFTDVSFQYPINFAVPSFCFTNTYRKRRFSKKPRIVTYIDGPFYPDKDLPKRKQKTDLRNKIYDKMTERAKMSDVVWIDYKRKEEDHNG